MGYDIDYYQVICGLNRLHTDFTLSHFTVLDLSERYFWSMVSTMLMIYDAHVFRAVDLICVFEHESEHK